MTTTDSSGRETLVKGGDQYIPYDPALRGNSAPTIGLPQRDAHEFADNREERCPIILVLDTSRSMEREPIGHLEKALKAFQDQLNADPLIATKVDVATILFDNTILYADFVNATTFQAPQLIASGGTIFSFPLEVAIDMIAKRKETYRLNGISHYRPWIVFITDGYPEHDTEEKIDEISRRLRDGEERREYSLFVITCGDANTAKTTDLLRDRIAAPNRPPKKTDDASFAELFNWLSNSMAAVSQSAPDDQVRIPDTSGWEIV